MAGGRKTYLLRFPTFEDVRFLDEDNPIESDISDDENSHLKYLIKCNGWTKLNLKGRNVYRLINQYSTSIWTPETVKRPEGYEDYLLRPLSPQSLAKIKNNPKEDIIELSSSSEDLSGEEPTEITTTRIMSSYTPQKRKREESSKVEAKHRSKKIAKTSSKTDVGCKEPNHTISSSEESESEPSLNEQEQLVSDINGQSVKNNDRLSPSMHMETPDSTAGDGPHPVGSDSEIESVQDGDSQRFQSESGVDKSQVTSTTQSAHSEKSFEEHIFTQKDKEEVSKFSSLLDPDIVKKNNMWILQCPTSMDCSDLVGQQINLTGSSKLDVGNQSYESFSYKSKDNRFGTLAVPTNENQLQLSSAQKRTSVHVQKSRPHSMLLHTPSPLGIEDISGPSRSPPLPPAISTDLVPLPPYPPEAGDLNWSPPQSTESGSSPPYPVSPEARFPDYTPPYSPCASPEPELWNKYRGRPLEEEEDESGYEIRIPISGNIIVEEFLDITSDSSFSVTEGPKCVEMPDNLQTRHPLFGKHYKKQLKIAKRMERMSLKKEHINVSSEHVSDVYESDVSSFSLPKKKKKKNKNKDN